MTEPALSPVVAQLILLGWEPYTLVGNNRAANGVWTAAPRTEEPDFKNVASWALSSMADSHFDLYLPGQWAQLPDSVWALLLDAIQEKL
jgi:hypothetical protein